MNIEPESAQAALTASIQNGIICHVAIPCIDLDASHEFYVGVLGSTLFREYKDRKTYGLANLQIVTHICSPDEVLWNPGVYPRHFGLTFVAQQDFDTMLKRINLAETTFVLEPQTRFLGKDEEHLTFIVRDPSHNLVEFKWYLNPAFAF
jgi:extradiol dioxygenase family protein